MIRMPSRLFKKTVQQGPSERRGEAYSVPYVEPLSVARTPLAGFFNSLLVSLCLGASSCGTVGPPIPPESVGIKAKMLEEQKRVEREAQPDIPPEAITPVGETPVDLPDLRPIGTR